MIVGFQTAFFLFYISLLHQSAAFKAICFIFIPAGISGDFRIGANRHLFIREGFPLCNHTVGRLVSAMPVFQKCERIYIIESLAAAAVVHAGYHKQAAEALGVWRVGVHLAEPCHLVFGGKHGVGHAGEHNQFAAACAEGGQIGGHRIVNRTGFGRFWACRGRNQICPNQSSARRGS